MCGIVAVVRRPPEGAPPELSPLLHDLDAVVARLAEPGGGGAAGLRGAATSIRTAAQTLRGPLGAGALIGDPVASAAFEHRASELAERFAAIEARLDRAADSPDDRDSGDAAEIGELGENTARLRAQIRGDDLLRRALRAETASAAVLAHTRWASVGIISEPNAHPLNHEEVGASPAVDAPYVTAALNGDVDN